MPRTRLTGENTPAICYEPAERMGVLVVKATCVVQGRNAMYELNQRMNERTGERCVCI